MSLVLPYGLYTRVTRELRPKGSSPRGFITGPFTTADTRAKEKLIVDRGPETNFAPSLPIGPGLNLILGGTERGKTTMLELLQAYADDAQPIIVYYEQTGDPDARLWGSVQELVGAIEDQINEYAKRLADGQEYRHLPIFLDSLTTLATYDPPEEGFGTQEKGRSGAMQAALRAWDGVFLSYNISMIATISSPSNDDAGTKAFAKALIGAVTSVITSVDQKVTITSRREYSDADMLVKRGDRAIDWTDIEDTVRTKLGRLPNERPQTQKPQTDLPELLKPSLQGTEDVVFPDAPNSVPNTKSFFSEY